MIPSRKRVTLRISERLLAEARSLGIDLDAAVEAGLEASIRQERIDKFQSLAAELSAMAARRGLTDEKLEEILATGATCCGPPTAQTLLELKRLVDEGLASGPGDFIDIDAIRVEARRRKDEKKPS